MLYSECWDDDAEKRPSCVQISDRLSIIGQLATVSNHSFFDELSSKYREELLKERSQDQIVNINSIKDWLAHGADCNKTRQSEHYINEGLIVLWL